MEGSSMTDVKIVATGLGFPEGPVVCADGSVVVTEIRNQRCSRVSPDGKVSVFSACGGGPNGLAIGPDGYFYLCNNGGSRYVEGHSMGLGPHPDYKYGTPTAARPRCRRRRASCRPGRGRSRWGSAPDRRPRRLASRRYARNRRRHCHICFGGADMRTAYVTLSDTGCLGVMQWPEPGLRLNFN
jgi:sugar lactone lactonase YvrE